MHFLERRDESHSNEGPQSEKHVYTNLIQPLPRYGGSSEEHLDGSGLSPCLSDDKTNVKPFITPTYSPESDITRTTVDHLESAVYDCSSVNDASKNDDSKVVKIPETSPSSSSIVVIEYRCASEEKLEKTDSPEVGLIAE